VSAIPAGNLLLGHPPEHAPPFADTWDHAHFLGQGKLHSVAKGPLQV